MKKMIKYLVCSAVLLSFAGIVYAASAFMKQPATLEKQQECKSLIPWKPEDVVAFEKAADIKEGALKFESFIVLDQPPKDRDASKTAKDLEKFKAKYAQKGKVPFKVTVSMDLTQKKDSKKVKYVNGKSEIYVINATDKKVLLKEKVDNAKLCPT
jgi:cell division protein FtsN